MKIDNRNDLSGISPAAATGATSVDSGNRRTTGGATGGTTSDSAELSGLAGKIAQAVGQDASDRAGQVEQLRSQVGNGTYQADSAAISRGVVNEALSSAATAGGSSRI
jgi:flagellar biosynthesis anti-sigma factor FlgM